MFLLDCFLNFIYFDENNFRFDYFPFITDWFLIFTVLCLLLFFIFYSFEIIFLLKSIVLLLFFDLIILIFIFHSFREGFFNFAVINSDFELFINNTYVVSSEIFLLKMLIVFIALLFFIVRLNFVYYLPSTLKEGLSFSIYTNGLFLKNVSIFYTFVLIFSIISILLLLSANNFMFAYLCIELFSLCSMILIASSSKNLEFLSFKYNKNFLLNNNLIWSLNYLLVSALGSSIFLLGVCYLYGHTGSLNFSEIKLFFLTLSFLNLVETYENISLLFSLLLLFFGLFIKGGFAPFHFWIFEIYRNLPYYLLTYFLLFAKLIIIIFLYKLSNILNGCVFFIYFVMGLLNILVGTFYLIKQKNIKVILIGSSINNSGYLLLCISFLDSFSFNVFFLFLFIYLSTNIGILLIMLVQSTLFKRANFFVNLNSLSSLHFFTFFNKFSLTFFIMSLMGLPFLLGFWSKSLLLLFFSEFNMLMLLKSSYCLNFLVIFFLVLNLISFIYYLNLISYLYFNQKTNYLSILINSKIYFSKVFFNFDLINILLISFLLFINIFLIFYIIVL